MAVDIVAQFLNTRALDLGPDDARLEKVKLAAEQVKNRCLENRALAIPLTMIPFAEAMPADDSTVQIVRQAVSDHWNTYLSLFPDEPWTLYQAVALQAVVSAAEEDSDVLAAAVLSSRNAYLCASTRQAQAIANAAFSELDRKYEAAARSQWALTEVQISKLPTIKPPADQVGAGFDEERLKTGLVAAASPNPHHPQNNINAWATEFGSRAANAIAGAFDDGEGEIGTVLDSLSKSVAAEVNRWARSVSAAIAGSSRAVNKRTSLLWWKEAMFSPSLSEGYRNLLPAVAATAASVDLQSLVDAAHPLSVEFFLRGMVSVVTGQSGADKKSFGAWLGDVLDDARGRQLFERLVLDKPQGNDIAPVVRLIAGVSGGSVSLAEVFTRYPQSIEEMEISAEDFSVWLFRELRALDFSNVTTVEA
ncbi:GTPase-associated system all-helical protein GASH [Burkholderia sp. SCN-KJ]|uniref:GTPase-associated system all-helical protein GASH n=1 Tax=Burkholderia sp. SCN-KJ TaxID=2969248 RepID=UPI002150229C|nr:GTPase-associated system all-helical protein GASH [Burkholderia sp. SCN-KJ]MCR4470412.1 hypothetical protein [Burkholderia sp. SCN-KJ]